MPASPRRISAVDGRPFFPLGGQARNSSSYTDAESEAAFRAVKQIGGNTLEIPVDRDQMEPKEVSFDFGGVDALLASARRHGVKLVLLWFARWKNGDMDSAPAWVKSNPARLHRVISRDLVHRQGLLGLSSHCPANLTADGRAFAASCDHLRARR
jgi:beta-galactosidase GanA